MTTPIYSLPMFTTATSAIHGSPAAARYGTPLRNYPTQGVGQFWDSLTDSISTAAGQIVSKIMPALETVATDYVRSNVGYSKTDQQVAYKDGRVGTLLKNPMGTLEVLFADGTTEPYDPTKAVGAPASTQSLPAGGMTGAGTTVAIVAVIGIAAFFMLRRKR